MHDIDRLARLDLNLLLSLVVLIETKNVSKAAARLHISQSAMSHRLSKLRSALGDEVLVQSGQQLIPTAHAAVLAPKLRDELASIARAIDSAHTFSPFASERQFRIVGPELTQVMVLPALLARLAKEAPRVGVSCVVHYPGFLDDLQNGRIDIAVLPGPVDVPGWMCSREIFSEPMVGVMSSDEDGEISLPAYLEREHVVVTNYLVEDNPVDIALRAMGLRRRTVVRVSSAMAVPMMLDHRRALTWAVTRGAGLWLAKRHSLRLFELPFTSPRVTLRAVWHRRDDTEPSHTWFRELMTSVSDTSIAENEVKAGA